MGVPIVTESAESGWLSVARGKGVGVKLVGQSRKAGENAAEVREGIDAMALAGYERWSR